MDLDIERRNLCRAEGMDQAMPTDVFSGELEMYTFHY